MEDLPDNVASTLIFFGKLGSKKSEAIEGKAEICEITDSRQSSVLSR